MAISEIVLSSMFTGNYLKQEHNIGHEIINLYKDSDGRHYLYINPYGTIHKKEDAKKYKTEKILFASPVDGTNAGMVSVVAMADGLEQLLVNDKSKPDLYKEQKEKQFDCLEYEAIIDRKTIKGKLKEIFQRNTVAGKVEEETIYVTFRADNVYIPAKPIFIRVKDNATKQETKESNIDDDVIIIKLKQDRDRIFGSGKGGIMYFPSLNKQNEKDEDFVALNECCNRMSNWKKIDEKIIVQDTPNFLSIIRKEDDEVIFSNMLHYYLQYSKEGFQKFCEKIFEIKDVQQYTITREEKNIDLLVRADDKIIIIENKIHSGINGIKDTENLNEANGNTETKPKKESQLSKYFNYAKKIVNNEHNIKCFIFAPNYHEAALKVMKMDLEHGIDYEIVTYKRLYEFFDDYKELYNKAPYFDDFLKAIEKHTAASFAEMKYRQMQERFGKAILMASKTNKEDPTQ